MHEMEGPRRVLLPCGRRSLGVRRPCRTCSSCSDSAIARLTRSRNGLLVAVCRSRSLGSSAYAERVPLAVRRSRSLGSGSYEERLPRRPGPDRSGPASAGLPRLALPRLLKAARRAANSGVRPDDCSPVHTSELITLVGNPLRTAVSRCSPRPGSRPPGRSPFPVTRRFLVRIRPTPQGLTGSSFGQFWHPQDSPQAVDGCPPDTARCPPRHPPVRPQPPSDLSAIWTRVAHS